MNPQIYEYLVERLFAVGALDVWITPILMKKSRPANQLSVLVDALDLHRCVEQILRETTTIGVRILAVGRIAAERETRVVSTPYGESRAKISLFQGRIVHVSAEYQDCKKIAAETGVPLKKIQQLVVQLANEQYAGDPSYLLKERMK